MARKGDPVERKVARIAAAAHGVVTRAELLAAGVSAEQVRRLARNGGLIRQHRGVYRAGHCAPSIEARYMAAVKACGEGAVLSGLAAAHLYGLVKGRPPPPEVTTSGRKHVRGIITRRSRHVQRALYRRIPITTVPRTLVDVASDLRDEELARACHEAGVRYGTTPRHVKAVLARRPNSPGAGKLRRIIEGDVPVSLSALESRFRVLLREAGLPLPVMNRPAGTRRVDCRWRDPPLIVELDGYRYHRSRHAWEQDRRREREARSRGDEFRRYTYGDVFEDSRYMLAELRALLQPHVRHHGREQRREVRQ